MKTIKRMFLVLVVIILIIVFNFIYDSYRCNLSDIKTINIANVFFSKIGIKYNTEPIVKNKGVPEMIINDNNYKIVYFGDSEHKLITEVDCNDMEVTHYRNDNIKYLALNKYTVNHNNKQVLEWPQFIPEQTAKDIINNFANSIGLPRDVEFSKLYLDKFNGTWTGRWKKVFNGIEFEDDYIIISIMATDGQLYGFTKSTKTKECLTNTKVTRSEATEVANTQFASYFTKDKWENNKDKFEIKSAELKIVRDKSILKRILSLGNKSRLAWVVVYNTKEGMDRETIGILNEGESFIRIDAVTKEILNREINVVP